MSETDSVFQTPEWLGVKMLQDKLGYKFNSPDLLILALTHTSWANERGRTGRHNERLEFLGDAVLELCISTELYHLFPSAREGDMTRMRSVLVKEETLARIAKNLKIADVLRLGKGEENQGGRERSSVLSDSMEAIFAAIYEDGGFDAVLKVIRKLYKPYWPEQWRNPKKKDCKSRLQELTQKLYKGLPVYALEGATGPEHAKVFVVSLTLPNGEIFHAADSSCKKAEQLVASVALERLEKKGVPPEQK